ncbi:DUF1152 domain-containing protein [Conexibacter arvalis]|uniref:DUF1152 domain-containing protein n=1 Tax=Conexibacter arvalis TaxID=912552 RepID=A0A840IES1_9ACTN|nr:hypothetical protein [Conexibacter arvalis]
MTFRGGAPVAGIDKILGHRRALAIGIGGGGDVVGAFAVAECCRALGGDAVIGGVTWERRPIDPLPGARRVDELIGAEPLHPAVALAGPETVGPGGFRFAESHMAGLLGSQVVLVDPNPGPAAIADGLAAAARRFDCDLVVLVDVGGDVLAHGDEPGLSSPLCDAVMLAAAPRLAAQGVETVGALFGAGCDAELTPDEVLERVAEVSAADGLLGVWGLTPPSVARLERAIEVVPTEASAQAVACARGAWGPLPIRGGRRTVQRTPTGAMTFYFDPAAAIASASRCTAAVLDADSLEAAQEILAAAGIRTELDYERDAAAGRI